MDSPWQYAELTNMFAESQPLMYMGSRERHDMVYEHNVDTKYELFQQNFQCCSSS